MHKCGQHRTAVVRPDGGVEIRCALCDRLLVLKKPKSDRRKEISD